MKKIEKQNTTIKTQKAAIQQKITHAGMELMMEKGYAATSISDICKHAKCTKGAFFHHHENKEDFAVHLTKYFWTMMSNFFMSADWTKSKNPEKRVLGMIDFFIDTTSNPEKKNKCLLGMFSLELVDYSEKIQKVTHESFIEWQGLVKQEFDGLKKVGEKNIRVNTESLAETFISVLEGALILSQGKNDIGVNQRAITHFKNYIQLLFDI